MNDELKTRGFQFIVHTSSFNRVVVELERRGRGADADDDRLGGGRVALVGDAADGDEDVGLGEVGGGAAARERVGHDEEAAGRALLAVEVAEEVYDLPGREPLLDNVFGVEEDD